MPAFRSDAEGLVRDAVVSRLRLLRPRSRIIHEIATGMGNRVDVLAVGNAEIIAVEIKSERDVLTRLPAQIEGMKNIAHHVIVAHHRNHDIGWHHGLHHKWRFPEEAIEGEDRDYQWKWGEPKLALNRSLPENALWMVWKDELIAICKAHGIRTTTRLTCEDLIQAIHWSMTGEQITKAVCQALRNRNCIEADPTTTEKPNE